MSVKDSDIDVREKIIVITGANTGIGYETALNLANRGAKVVLACRDRTRAQTACDKIKAATKNENVFVELLDLGDLNSVRNFAKSFQEKWKRLDILINNAGIALNERRITKDGFEMHFGVNYLGHFLLTNLLLDLMKRSTPSRIINVSSQLYKRGKMEWDDLNLEKDFGSLKAYNQSKLANVLFTIALAKRLNGTGVSTVSLHPGLVKTDMNRNYPGFLGCILGCLTCCVGISPEEGAQTSIYCTVTKSIPDFSGQYFSDCAAEPLVERLTSDVDAERLWDISAKMVKL